MQNECSCGSGKIEDHDWFCDDCRPDFSEEEEDSEAYIEGYNSWTEDCPYDAETNRYYDWWKGYNDSHRNTWQD